VSVNKLYHWNSHDDKLEKVGDFVRLMEEIGMYSGMTPKEIEADLEERKKILSYMVRNKIYDINDVGRITAEFYRNRKALTEAISRNAPPSELLGHTIPTPLAAQPAPAQPPPRLIKKRKNK